MEHVVAKVEEVPVGTSKCVEVCGQRIALFNVGGKFYAVDNDCTHVGGPLSEGFVEDTRVTCPWHGAQFDLQTGEALEGPVTQGLRCYAVVTNGLQLTVNVDPK